MKRRRGSSDNFSAEIIGCNESILTIILLHLPVKSLLTLKLVCKSWYSLISDPYFTHAHTLTSIKKYPSFLSPSGFFISNSFDNKISNIFLPKRRRKVSLPSLSFLGQSFIILQSCNGLLLGRLSSGICCVCNPTTGKFKILPSAKVDGEYHWISPFTLAFDPSQTPNYRIVCFKRFKKKSPESTGSNYYLQIFIYLSEMVTWKASTCFEASVCTDISAGIFSNGAVHWVSHEQYIRFDMDEEKVMLMTHQYNVGGLWQWGGTVYLARKNFIYWNFYEIDQGTFKWTSQKNHFPCDLLKDVLRAIAKKEGTEQTRRYDLTEAKFSVIAIVKGDKEEGIVVLVTVFGRIVLYNWTLRKVKIFLDLELPDYISGDACRNCISAHQYIETLSSV